MSKVRQATSMVRGNGGIAQFCVCMCVGWFESTHNSNFSLCCWLFCVLTMERMAHTHTTAREKVLQLYYTSYSTHIRAPPLSLSLSPGYCNSFVYTGAHIYSRIHTRSAGEAQTYNAVCVHVRTHTIENCWDSPEGQRGRRKGGRR